MVSFVEYSLGIQSLRRWQQRMRSWIFSSHPIQLWQSLPEKRLQVAMFNGSFVMRWFHQWLWQPVCCRIIAAAPEVFHGDGYDDGVSFHIQWEIFIDVYCIIYDVHLFFLYFLRWSFVTLFGRWRGRPLSLPFLIRPPPALSISHWLQHWIGLPR